MERNTFSKFCLKLFLRLIGLNVCCFIACTFCISSSGSRLIRTLIQIACIIAMVSFVYPVCHKVGDIDAPLVNVGHKKHNPLKGLYAGLIASSPFILSALVLLITKISGAFPAFVNYYKMINSLFFAFLYSIMPVDYTLTELYFGNILAGLSVQVVIPVICMFSYMLGLNHFSFSEKLLYKKKEA